MMKGFSFFVGSCLLTWAAVAPTYSATITVDAAGGGDATSVADAVTMAFGNAEADEIVIKPGVYSVDSVEGETLVFLGEDDITLRGEDPDDRPVIVVEPNFNDSVPGEGDGVKIKMGGSLTFESLIFVPSENFTFLPDVDDMFAVQNQSDTESSTLDLTFRHVVITHSDLDYTPTTLTGFDDPRGADNIFRDDAINIEALEPSNDTINLLLDGVIITGYGDVADSDAVVLDGPNIAATIEGGSVFSFIRRRGVFAFTVSSVTINGSDDNPSIIYGAGETMIRASAGVHEWNHLWCVGLNEGPDGINTGFASRIDPNGGASVVANDCIFSTAISDGVFMNFGSEEPLSYEFNRCTFHNVPELIRFGFVGEPGPSDNVSVTATDCIVDNFFWTAPADGTYFSPEPNVVHYGDGDNTLANLTINNMAYSSISFVSSTSGSSEPTVNGNLIDDPDFMFESDVFSADTLASFLVVTNCDALGTMGTNGTPLGGARLTPCSTGVHEWSVH